MERLGGGQAQKVGEEVKGGNVDEQGDVEVKGNNNEEELQMFYHHLPPLAFWNKIVLLLAGPFLVPLRLVLAILTAWLVSGLGLMFRDKDNFERQPQSGWRAL